MKQKCKLKLTNLSNLKIFTIHSALSIQVFLYTTSEAATSRRSTKKHVLKNFAEFTGKHLSQSLFFDKAADWGLHLYLKKDSDTCVFLWIFRTLFVEQLQVTTSAIYTFFIRTRSFWVSLSALIVFPNYRLICLYFVLVIIIIFDLALHICTFIIHAEYSRVVMGRLVSV